MAILSGKATLGCLARRFGVPEHTIEKWREQTFDSFAQAMRQGDVPGGREPELERELKALRGGYTDVAIRHGLRETALTDRKCRSTGKPLSPVPVWPMT